MHAPNLHEWHKEIVAFEHGDPEARAAAKEEKYAAQVERQRAAAAS